MIKPVKDLRLWLFVLAGMAFSNIGFSQNPVFHVPMQITDTTKKSDDSLLRIRNLNPYFTLHVDSTLSYQLELNRDPGKYFFFMKNAPVGIKVRENGLLTFKADKSYFLSGRLKYDYEYKVNIGVQNLNDPKDRVDTSFTIVFFHHRDHPFACKTDGQRRSIPGRGRYAQL